MTTSIALFDCPTALMNSGSTIRRSQSSPTAGGSAFATSLFRLVMRMQNKIFALGLDAELTARSDYL